MALYDYTCLECSQTKTITRPISENEPPGGYSCSTCNSVLTRVYSNVGVSFKGSGFYSTDK
jgi:putative FmdB family regulatory protein